MKKKIEAALNDLGSTSREVADKLRSLGIKGHHRYGDCPVARYLKAKDDPETNFCVYPLATGYCNKNLVHGHLRNPKAVVDFVNDFDNGKYPELAEDPIPPESPRK